MDKGFVRVLEVFLAIQLMVIFLGTIQAHRNPGHYDPYNMPRLRRNAESIAFSICNNDAHRKNITEGGSIPPLNLEETIPEDLEYGLKLYSGDRFSNEDYSSGEFKDGPGVATSGCIMAGHTLNNITSTITLDECSEGAACVTALSSSNEVYQYVPGGGSLTVGFPVTDGERGFKSTLTVEAIQDGDGSTTISIYDGVNHIDVGTLVFSSVEKEIKSIDIGTYLPDGADAYNLTLEPSVGTSYDHVLLNVTRVDPHYSPYKLVVGVWNR